MVGTSVLNEPDKLGSDVCSTRSWIVRSSSDGTGHLVDVVIALNVLDM